MQYFPHHSFVSALKQSFQNTEINTIQVHELLSGSLDLCFHGTCLNRFVFDSHVNSRPFGVQAISRNICFSLPVWVDLRDPIVCCFLDQPHKIQQN